MTDIRQRMTAAGIPDGRQNAILNHPYPMGSETQAELKAMADWRKERGLSDDPPHGQGVAGGRD